MGSVKELVGEYIDDLIDELFYLGYDVYPDEQGIIHVYDPLSNKGIAVEIFMRRE